MTDPQPDFTSPIAGRIEVRDPCPWCADRPMIPRTLMDEHVARLHPEVETIDTVAAPAVQAPAADRAAVRAEAFEDAAKMLAGLDPVKAALAGQHAWNDAAGLVRHMATQERRMADEAQPDVDVRCTCGDAGACFAPAGHYADCPDAAGAQRPGESR